MKLSTTIIALATASTSTAAFVPQQQRFSPSKVIMKGYLDDLNADLYKEDDAIDVEADNRENNKMAKNQVDRFGPGNLNDYVEFTEFDGGDGQMGVAGDGTTGLDKSDFDQGALASQMNKSRARSAKNAWGTSTGYADQLVEEKGMDVARAQQLENWHNQREINQKKQAQSDQAAQYDNIEENAEANWRTLAKFGVERNQEFDLSETFGAATAQGGDIEGTIEIKTRPGGMGYHEFALKNPYMGFADFRATFTPETSQEWIVQPSEGSLMQKEATNFSVKFRPGAMGVSEGFLVIDTEDFKKVWKVIGSTG